MKAVSIITSALASSSATIAATVPVQPRDVADGFYQVVTDDAGNTRTEFTAFDFDSVQVSPNEARGIEKRREACGPGSASTGEADQANACLINTFSGNNVALNKNAWTYCVRGNVVSFICPYSNGYKPKDNIKGTWSYVKSKCGPSKMGYAQVSGGTGDWTAGFAVKSDHFCTKGFHVGD